MNKYRVLMQDSVNGQAFNFAMTYEATNPNDAADLADVEFLDAYVVDVTKVEPTLGELLKRAIDASNGLYIEAAIAV